VTTRYEVSLTTGEKLQVEAEKARFRKHRVDLVTRNITLLSFPTRLVRSVALTHMNDEEMRKQLGLTDNT
jgi:hypothetical protein